jgi:hypothetical protein
VAYGVGLIWPAEAAYRLALNDGAGTVPAEEVSLIHSNHALVLLRAGQPSDAVAASTKALELNPCNAKAANRQAQALLEQTQAASGQNAVDLVLRAAEAAELAARFSPNDAMVAELLHKTTARQHNASDVKAKNSQLASQEQSVKHLQAMLQEQDDEAKQDAAQMRASLAAAQQQAETAASQEQQVKVWLQSAESVTQKKDAKLRAHLAASQQHDASGVKAKDVQPASIDEKRRQAIRCAMPFRSAKGATEAELDAYLSTWSEWQRSKNSDCSAAMLPHT